MTIRCHYCGYPVEKVFHRKYDDASPWSSSEPSKGEEILGFCEVHCPKPITIEGETDTYPRGLIELSYEEFEVYKVMVS